MHSGNPMDGSERLRTDGMKRRYCTRMHAQVHPYPLLSLRRLDAYVDA